MPRCRDAANAPGAYNPDIEQQKPTDALIQRLIMAELPSYKDVESFCGWSLDLEPGWFTGEGSMQVLPTQGRMNVRRLCWPQTQVRSLLRQRQSLVAGARLSEGATKRQEPGQ